MCFLDERFWGYPHDLGNLHFWDSELPFHVGKTMPYNAINQQCLGMVNLAPIKNCDLGDGLWHFSPALQ